MATVSLLKLNHDHADAIARDPAGFVAAVLDYMRRPISADTIDHLRYEYYVTPLGAQHSDSPYSITWCGRTLEKKIT